MDDPDISSDPPETPIDLSNYYFNPKKAMANYLRVCRLITVLCNDLFRDILSHYIKPSDLRAELDKNKIKLMTIMNTDQKKKMYPRNGNTSLTSNDLDISVIYIVLRNICNIPEHYNGWGNYPNKNDTSIAACIERIRIQRGIIAGHSANGRVEDDEFQNHWSEIRNAVVDIEKQLIGGDVFQRGIDHMLTSDLDCFKPKKINAENKAVQANLQPATRDYRCASNTNEAEAFYRNRGDRVKFANLFEELAVGVPEEKIEKMKSLIQNSCEGISGSDIQNAVSARDCLTFLTNANLLTWKDVIFIQYLMKKLDCGQLYEQCYRYAEKIEALCFHERPIEKGFSNVHFHVHGNLNDYGREQIENIKATVANMVGCSSEDILIGGFSPSSSFLVVLSIKEIYVKRLCNLDQEDKNKLSRLDIDYFIIDLEVVFFESSKEKEWYFYYDQRNSSQSNKKDRIWIEGFISLLQYKMGIPVLPSTENTQQVPPRPYVYPSHSEVEFLDFVKPYSALIPEISKPNSKIQFKERVFYTLCAIFIFLLSREIPLFGIKYSRTEDIFFFMRDITASKKGTLMEFGVLPICIAGDIVELFVISKLPLKERNTIDNALIKGANKLFTVLVALVLASLLVTNGIYGEPAELGVGVCFLIIIQLTLAGLIVSLLINMINNGYGMGYGIYLFIATNVCGTVMWKAFSPETVTNDRGTEFEGAIIALFNVFGNKYHKRQAFLNAFSRKNLPNLMHLLCTIQVCGIFIYILRLHLSLPTKSLQFKGHRDHIKIKPPYILILHITMTSSYLMSLFYLVSKMLAEKFSGYSLFNFIGVWADVPGDGPARSYPTGGLCYYLSPPETHIIADPVQVVFYTGFNLGCCAILFNRFNSLLGLSAKEIVKSLKDQKMVLVGQLEQSMLNELNGYISTTITCSGLLFGALSAVADYMGVFGSGPGILLAITLISAYYDICTEEHKKDDGYNTLLF